MRITPVLLLLLMSGCSKPLKVDFVNQSGRILSICEIGDGFKKCQSVAPEATARLVWRSGKFEILESARIWRYQAIIPEPFGQYINESKSSVTIVVAEDLRLFIAPAGSVADAAVTVGQPQGYPLVPDA